MHYTHLFIIIQNNKSNVFFLIFTYLVKFTFYTINVHLTFDSLKKYMIYYIVIV